MRPSVSSLHARRTLTASGPRRLKEKATDALIATHPDQVDGFLSEFKDHGVVRSSRAAPDIIEGVNDDEDDDEAREEGGEWVWIPLAREALEEVLEELGIDE